MYDFFANTYVWCTMAVISLLVCLDIEYQWLLIPSESLEVAQATNRIILALSYSYIAAVIFHIVVVFFPFKARQRSIGPLLNHMLFQLTGKIRLAYEVPISIFSTRLVPYTKEEYVSMFASMDMYEYCIYPKGMTKLERLESLRNDINDSLTLLLTYREYLNENVFRFLNEVAASSFMVCDIIPFNSDRDELDNNQRDMGESIYAIRELSKQWSATSCMID